MKEVQIIDGKKSCSKCRKNLPIDCFSRVTDSKCGLGWACKKCHSKQQATYRAQNVEKVRERSRKFYRDNRRKVQSRQLERLYNISLVEYDQMFEQQNGVCAICKLPEIMRRLSVDHNHKTGKVRGLLCISCNILLGLVQEDVQIIESIKKYLEIYKSANCN